MNCEIGAFCSIANNVVIGPAEHLMTSLSTSAVFYEGKSNAKVKFSNHSIDYKKTLMGNDVWIGESVLIKAGISIGDGAVIGMGSVVTKDVGPYEIWAGNPARLIKKRFDDETIIAF